MGRTLKIESSSDVENRKRKNESSDNEEKNKSKDSDEKKKKKSRWGVESEKSQMILPPIASNMSKSKQDAIIAQLRIVEINKLLATDLGISSDITRRSPSPEPVYDNKGVRINTREYRTRKKLEEERQFLVHKTIQLDPTFQPPPTLKLEAAAIEDRIDIPQDQYPHINFIGLLIGPRGNTLKEMEKSSGAKIMIRGKGSVKPGKGRVNGQPTPGEDEELHALIRAPEEISFNKARDRINKIIKIAIDCPEEQNQLKKQQLELLAKMNGTFREDSLFIGCGNCGSTEHREWECLERKNAVISIVCNICGGAGHIDSDCLQKNKPDATVDKDKMDREFALFLQDLGEEVPEDLKNKLEKKNFDSNIDKNFHLINGVPHLPLPPPFYAGFALPQRFPVQPNSMPQYFNPMPFNMPPMFNPQAYPYPQHHPQTMGQPQWNPMMPSWEAGFNGSLSTLPPPPPQNPPSS